MRTSEFASQLFVIGAMQVDFNRPWILKSGLESPVYFNLHVLMSYPKLVHAVTYLMRKVAFQDVVSADLVAGVPQAGLPYGLEYSQQTNIPHILPRLKQKDHGTGQKIDGVYEYRDRVLLIDDVITAGTSFLEVSTFLRQCRLMVRDAMVILDRQQGGRKALSQRNITLHSVMTVDFLLRNLRRRKQITPAIEEKLRAHLHIVPDTE